jgi:hypothetical protein
MIRCYCGAFIAGPWANRGPIALAIEKPRGYTVSVVAPTGVEPKFEEFQKVLDAPGRPFYKGFRDSMVLEDSRSFSMAATESLPSFRPSEPFWP